MRRSLPSVLTIAVILAIALPSAARAYLLRVDFNVLADWNDPVHKGQTASGYFNFDSSLIPPPSPYGGYDTNWRTTGFHIPALSFTWDGHEWTTLDADLVAVQSDPNGNFYAWAIGGKPNGLNGVGAGAPDFWASPFDFTYGTAYGGAYHGSTTYWYSSPVRVPEPSMLLLLAPGLLALGTIRRRKK